MKVISLFSGAMGLDLGLEAAGFKLAVAVECDSVAVETIKTNRPRLKVIARRLEHVTTAEILKAARVKAGGDVVVVGGPSCQAFSTAGQRRSMQDPRGIMFREFIRVVREIRPRYFIMENVRGLLSAAIKHRPLGERGPGHPQLKPREELGSAFRVVTRELAKLNYHVEFDLLNAADFGVPQTRQRLVFLGSRDGKAVEIPKPTHSADGASGLPQWTTLRSVIQDIHLRGHTFTPFRKERKELFGLIPEGGNWRSLPRRKQAKALGAAYHSWGGRSGFLRRLTWDKPSPALVTMPDGNATCFGHPTEHRPLSVEEYARLQQFPDDWKFAGSVRQQYRQIGNAVPLGLGAAIGRALKTAIRSRRVGKPLGVVECSNAVLLRRLDKTLRTYLNPPRMRKNTDPKAIAKWRRGRPRARTEGRLYASPSIRSMF